MEFCYDLFSDPELVLICYSALMMVLGWLFGWLFKGINLAFDGIGQCLSGIGTYFAAKAKIALDRHSIKRAIEEEAP